MPLAATVTGATAEPLIVSVRMSPASPVPEMVGVPDVTVLPLAGDVNVGVGGADALPELSTTSTQ